ncbi:polyvinyl alcohol dehydrogenase (cytochrome) [Sphingobium faniae]|nr:polyvinyl alcohol dehydrogenase (cytochrome) [Sphingobium faniae]
MKLGTTLLAAAAVLFSAAALNAADDEKSGKALNEAFLAAERAREAMPGAAIYRETCLGCHDGSVPKAPLTRMLGAMLPEAIVQTLRTGVMRDIGETLSDDQRIAVANYLTSPRKFGDAKATALRQCEASHARFDLDDGSEGAIWGQQPGNNRFIPAAQGGISKDDIPRLKLKWAFGFPNASRVRSQPALVGGSAIMGSHDGRVYALDRETGCVRWTFAASGEVQTGILVTPWNKGDRNAQPIAIFGDGIGKVYALDARDGKLLWSARPEEHGSAKITAAAAYHDGMVYVPVSSGEIAAAGNPAYGCCTFRGQVVAYDARTGRQVWKSFTVGTPVSQGHNSAGTEIFGPSGAPVWNTPTVDAKRGSLYFGTGENYSDPATETSDAIIAVDLKTGKRKWHFQGLAGDAWNMSCGTSANANCPKKPGPDFDFAAPPVLVTLKDGSQILVAGQKSGWVFGISPDDGRLQWKRQVGRGGLLGGIHFSLAAEGERVYVPVADTDVGVKYPGDPRPGIYALDARTGEYLWEHPIADTCGGKPLCHPGTSGSVTAGPGYVLNGSMEGLLRVHGGATGKVIWQYDTTAPVMTVNGDTAKGGAFGGGAGPVMKDGLLFVSSGYGYAVQAPGNALLVFEVDGKGAAK